MSMPHVIEVPESDCHLTSGYLTAYSVRPTVSGMSQKEGFHHHKYKNQSCFSWHIYRQTIQKSAGASCAPSLNLFAISLYHTFSISMNNDITVNNTLQRMWKGMVGSICLESQRRATKKLN